MQVMRADCFLYSLNISKKIRADSCVYPLKVRKISEKWDDWHIPPAPII